MDNLTKDLHELCETLARSIAAANEKIRSAGGKLSTGDVDYVDKLVHATKSIKAIEKMMEETEMMGDDGYSERYSRSYDRGSYRSYNDGGSYGRGRMNARRDAMGRYSRDDGYSRGGNTVDELREIMRDLPDDARQQMQDIVRKLEQR
jgi:hypothetical protein